MPWRGVTVSEQRQRFLEDYQLNYYSVTELAERLASQERPPINGSTASSSSGNLAITSFPAGRIAARGRRMR